MTDETNIIPADEFDSPGELTPEMLMQAGDALSKSLLFTLRRDYLDSPAVAREVVRMTNAEIPQQPDLALLELEQVGKPLREDTSEYFTAIQTTLAACHDPRYARVFIVSSDGLRNRIYIGVVARQGGTQPRIFAEQVGQFLGSNWPGTRVRLVEDYAQVARHVHVPLSTYRHARALTGIPSIK